MDDIAQDPSSPSAAQMAEYARPAWELYAAAHPGVTIADLISDLLHLADSLPEEQYRGADAILDRARRDYFAERP
ncbi:hypothetical protein ACFYZ8_33430 [Streptomyces sp. NPDC001668]|uniref:hypothetical protein n=1 Tax=Streptomyces sp. NPDC001668 TaxID=3364598 RepID=UPI0036B91D47